MAGTILACEMALREAGVVSMESGLDGRNNGGVLGLLGKVGIGSQWSPA